MPTPAADPVVTFATPRGPARLHVALPAGRARPGATLLLGHGAGGGVDAPDLVAVRRAALEVGVAVARLEQPWRVAGRRVAAPPAHLDDAHACALHLLDGDAVAQDDPAGALPLLQRARSAGPLVVGGRSAGARVACRSTASYAGGLGAVLTLAFPWHPPGRPERDRGAELALPAQHGVPVVAVQGDRDAFGCPPAGERVELLVVPGADHAFRVAAALRAGRSPDDVLGEVARLAVAGLSRAVPAIRR